MTKKTTNKTLKHLILLLSTFTIGMIFLISLHMFFLNLVEKLDKKTLNLESKMQIGEYVVNDLYKIRSDFYELATTVTNKRGREIINKRIKKRIEVIKKSLEILENGGTLKRTIRLNIVGHNDTTRTIEYKKEEDSISLEVIDLAPKLEQFEMMIASLNELLKVQSFYRKDNDVVNFMAQNRIIKRFYKRTPAFFIRITENANRLLYEGSIELNEIQKEIEKQKEQYIKLEFILIMVFLSLAITLGFIIAIQINKNTKLLERQEQFSRGTLDAQESIVVVSDGEEMIDANQALIEFFEGYDSFADFKSKHICICDFFEEVEGEDLIVGREHKGVKWYEYIVQNPDEQHKVAITKDDIQNYFTITATKKEIDSSNSIIIVALNNITNEMQIQKELKKLNENLEDIVDEKTSELQELNETLENKIAIEVEKNREKDRTLIQQSRFAALGEMLGNIAHQWRQPLSAITSTATSIQVQMKLDLASKDDINNSYNSIIKYVDFLNQTIEDFRGFFRKDKEKEEFNILNKIDNAISITNAVYKDNSIKLIKDTPRESYKILGFPNELSQVFLNILNNAKDVLIEREIQEKVVLIKVYESPKSVFIELLDNAGGIRENQLLKVFDPYFTTKHKSQGTGIGLYMSKYIIEKNMKGLLTVSNKEISYNDKSYLGACFKIELPKI